MDGKGMEEIAQEDGLCGVDGDDDADMQLLLAEQRRIVEQLARSDVDDDQSTQQQSQSTLPWPRKRPAIESIENEHDDTTMPTTSCPFRLPQSITDQSDSSSTIPTQICDDRSSHAHKNETSHSNQSLLLSSSCDDSSNSDDGLSSSDEDESKSTTANNDGVDVDELLEEPYKNWTENNKDRLIESADVREKIVLEHRGTEYFEVLPDGWIEITHRSGLPVFLHKSSRVCTFSRPYFIGPGSVRNHPIPISAIPCLHQRHVRDEMEKAESTTTCVDGDDPRAALVRLGAPDARVQTAEDFRQRQLTPDDLHNYAKSVFKFKTIRVCRFNKWSTTRSYHKRRKQAEATARIDLVGRPSLPSNVQLITVPLLEKNSKPQQKTFFLNPQGKTSVSVLHEYVQKVLKSTIKYEFDERRNPSKPYSAVAKLKTVVASHRDHGGSIKERLMRLKERQQMTTAGTSTGQQPTGSSVADDEFVTLGSGFGNSKKVAKLEAARRALEVLIPGIEFDEDGLAANSTNNSNTAGGGGGAVDDSDAIALFDLVPLEDSRIPELSAKAGQPTPYLILQDCLKRNATSGDTQITTETRRLKHQKHMYQMTVGKHRVSVVCTNQKEGKQKASQAMLKRLHPQIDTWGSLIRLYGHEAQRKLHETRKTKDSIIKLQGVKSNESTIEPNMAILDKLRQEMDALYARNRNPMPVDTPYIVNSIDI